MKNTEEILTTVLSELDLSRSKIAEDLDVSLQAISNWCSRNRIPQKAKKYFYKVHGVNRDFLDSGEGPILNSNYSMVQDNHSKYIEHLEKENQFLRELVKTLTDFKNQYNKE